MPPHDDAPAMAGTAGRGRGQWAGLVFVAGIVAMAFNLRAAITSLPPVFSALASQLDLGTFVVAALASTPALCFAVFSPVAAPLSRRFGEERVLMAALALLAAGLLLRGALPGWLLFPGTVLAAGSIALMNVLLPSLVKRRNPAQAGLLIGTYLLSLSAGAILGALFAVPVLRASGGSLPAVLGLWALPAGAAALAWLPQWRFRTLPPAATGTRPGGTPVKVSRHRLAWQVMGFMGLQSLTYYSALSWLPTLFQDRGLSALHAGDLLALMNFGNAAGALLIPVLAHRTRDQRTLIAVTVAAGAAGITGAWFAPLASALVWVLVLGFGQGAALGLAIYLTTARAPDAVTAASLSSFAQGAGYLVATTGPLLIGFLHTATGGWALPVAALLVIYTGEFGAGWHAARDRVLPRARSAAGEAA